MTDATPAAARGRGTELNRIRLVIAGLAAATTVAALTATPTQAVTTATTGVAKVFMVNPVQSSGNQDLTDQ